MSDTKKEITDKQLQQAYQNVFGSETGQLVLDDLSYRCFKYTTTVGFISHDEILVNEGRRQTLLHIESQLKPITKE